MYGGEDTEYVGEEGEYSVSSSAGVYDGEDGEYVGEEGKNCGDEDGEHEAAEGTRTTGDLVRSADEEEVEVEVPQKRFRFMTHSTHLAQSTELKSDVMVASE